MDGSSYMMGEPGKSLYLSESMVQRALSSYGGEGESLQS